jgi:outer membrane protein
MKRCKNRTESLLLSLLLASGMAGCAVAPQPRSLSSGPLLEQAADAGPGTAAAPAAPTPAPPALAPPAVSPDGNEPLTLQDCLRLAEANSRRISIVDRRVLLERDRRLEAFGLVLPRITGQSRASFRSNDQGIIRDGESFVTGGRDIQTASLGLLVPIYDFGGAFSQIKAQRLQIHAAQLDAEQERQDLRLEVTRAYFQILEARKIKTVVEESIQSVEQQLKISRDYYDQGLVAKNDLLVSEVQLARRQQELIQAENAIELSVSTLNRLTGLSVTRPTKVRDITVVEPWNGSFDSLVSLALAHRPDLKAFADRAEIASALYRSARSSFFPRLFAFGEADYSSDSTLLNNTWLSGGFGMNITLLDASTFARIREQRKLADEAADQRQDRVDEAMLEIQRAYLSVRNASETLPVTQKNIDQAEENLRITRDRYREGLVTSADVLVEEERFAQARSDYYAALYGYHQAFAELVHTVGATPTSASTVQGAMP